MRKEAEPGLSMANCVSQRKARPACSQPLRSRDVGLKPFQGQIEWSPAAEWSHPETSAD